MTPDDLHHIQEILSSYQKQIHELRCAHEGILRTIVEVLPRDEAIRILGIYEKHKAKFWEESLLAYEKDFPRLAAELDKHRPLISPDAPDVP